MHIKLSSIYVHISLDDDCYIATDGGGDRPTQDGKEHIPDAMTQRLEALAKRLAIEQKVSIVEHWQVYQHLTLITSLTLISAAVTF